MNQLPETRNQGPGTSNQGPGTLNQGARGMVKAVSAPMVSGSPQSPARNKTLLNVQTTTPSTRPPTFTWQKGSFSLEDILKNFPLPRVIQCDHIQCGAHRQSDGFDCSQPLLVHSSLVSLKVSAVGLAVNIKDGKSLVETDSRLLVSEDYKGWFAVLGSDLTQKTIPHYRCVAQLSQSDCHTFLIGGFDNVKTLQKVGDSISEGRHLCPGDVLKMGVLKDGNKYLHCTDDRDRDVLLPLDGVGVFLVITHKTKPSRTPVLQIKNIISKYKLPCNVKLVYGREPADAGVFTKFMVLERVREHTSLLTATILKPRSTLHDLPVNIQKRFRVAVPNPDLPKSPGYASALSLCVDSGDRFMRGIRLFKKDAEIRPNSKTTSTNIASKSEVNINGNVKALSSAVKDLPISTKPPTVIDTRRHGADPIISPTSPFSKAKAGVVPGSNGNATNVKHKPTVKSPIADPSTAVRSNVYEKIWPASSSRGSHDSSPASVLNHQKMGGQLVIGKVHVDSNSQNASSKPPGVIGSSVVTPTSASSSDYEQVWSASSSRTSSDVSSTASGLTQRGMGGQLVTGGVHADSNSQTISLSMHPVISKSNRITHKVGTTTITDISPPKPCEADVQDIEKPKACKGGNKSGLSFQTNINVANNSHQSLSNDRHATPEADPCKKKTVTFATNIDVHTDAKHNAARRVVSELTQKHINFTDGDIPRPEHSTGKVVSFEDFSPGYVSELETSFLMTRPTRVPDSGEDEEGYMIPVLDRKGRVKSMHHYPHRKEARTKESLAKMMSLPKMSHCIEGPLDSDTESHLLY